MFVYENQLNKDTQWAIREGSMHFKGGGAVHETLKKITQRLDELGIPYAIVKGMALFLHGYRRFTESVDLLVSEDGLAEIHEKLLAVAMCPPFRQQEPARRRR